MASFWGKAACPGHPFGSRRCGVGNTLGYNGPFPETLSQRVYEVWFLISWGSATGISAAVQRTLHPLLPQWASAEAVAHWWLGGFGCVTSGTCCCRWRAEDHVWSQDTLSPKARGGLRRENSMWSIPGFPALRLWQQARFHWKFTGSLKVFTLQEFDIFQILSHTVETTESEPFTRSKLFRLWSYSGQHSLPFLLCPWCTQTHLPEELPCYSSSCSCLFFCIFVFPTPVLYWLAALSP